MNFVHSQELKKKSGLKLTVKVGVTALTEELDTTVCFFQTGAIRMHSASSLYLFEAQGNQAEWRK